MNKRKFSVDGGLSRTAKEWASEKGVSVTARTIVSRMAAGIDKKIAVYAKPGRARREQEIEVFSSYMKCPECGCACGITRSGVACLDIRCESKLRCESSFAVTLSRLRELFPGSVLQ